MALNSPLTAAGAAADLHRVPFTDAGTSTLTAPHVNAARTPEPRFVAKVQRTVRFIGEPR
jgi:hypothetical protein